MNNDSNKQKKQYDEGMKNKAIQMACIRYLVVGYVVYAIYKALSEELAQNGTIPTTLVVVCVILCAVAIFAFCGVTMLMIRSIKAAELKDADEETENSKESD